MHHRLTHKKPRAQETVTDTQDPARSLSHSPPSGAGAGAVAESLDQRVTEGAAQHDGSHLNSMTRHLSQDCSSAREGESLLTNSTNVYILLLAYCTAIWITSSRLELFPMPLAI